LLVYAATFAKLDQGQCEASKDCRSVFRQLEGRTALITGGGSGIGLAVAQRFVREGCRVVIAGRSPDKLEAAVASLKSEWVQDGEGGSALPVRHAAEWEGAISSFPCDVSDPAQVRNLVGAANQRLGRIDILVNNAGLNIKQRTVRELNPESWQLLVDANLNGAFYCIHAVLPQMIERGDGLIINISSTAGKRATPLGGAAYSAAKFGMSALSHCLGIEERDHGIRCTVIYPGEVDTPIMTMRPQPVTAEQRSRMLRPDDVASAAVFVAALPPHVNVPELIIKPTSQGYA
jgi:NAD(P)-dependent dehydrogenase (short-subunit alcohol dehydrogenase family)